MLTFGIIEPGRFYTPRPGAYALISGADGTLLVIDDRGEIILPGGGLDPGETAEQALVRELREETGHAVSVGPQLGEAREFAFEPDYDTHFEKLCVFFRAELGPRICAPVEETHVMLWLPPEEAVRRLSKGSQRWAAERSLAKA
jgi:8-oxo-dGTP diphosphatase